MLNASNQDRARDDEITEGIDTIEQRVPMRDIIEFHRKRLGCQGQLREQHEHRVQFDGRRRLLDEFGNAVEALHVQSIQHDE